MTSKEFEMDIKNNIIANFGAAILDSVTESIAVLDKNRRIVYINKIWIDFAERSGRKASKTYIGEDYFEVCKKITDDCEALNEVFIGISEVINGERESYSLEYPCNSGDSKKWFYLRVAPLAESKNYVIVSQTDITERIEAEISLYESQAGYHRLIEFSPYAIFVLSDGLVQYVNMQALRLLEISDSENIIGKPIKGIFNSDYALKAEEFLERVQDKGEILYFDDYKVINSDGVEGYIEIAMSPLVYNGKPSVQATVRDMTEEKMEIKRAFHLQNHRLNTKFPMKDKAIW